VGALGGGDVSLIAGTDVRNVDAVIPTNARAPRGVPDPNSLLELGGGDLLVRSGQDINAGVYYVERGSAILEASGNITTNATRSPSLGILQSLNNPNTARFDALTWLPTTLFAGKSNFDVTARGDVLLGPISNPFLLPQGVNNRFWSKSYFSTFSEQSGAEVTSLGGDVTLRNSVATEDSKSPVTFWRSGWSASKFSAVEAPPPTINLGCASQKRAWCRLRRSSGCNLPLLQVTALSGDVDVAGNLTVFPVPKANLSSSPQDRSTPSNQLACLGHVSRANRETLDRGNGQRL